MTIKPIAAAALIGAALIVSGCGSGDDDEGGSSSGGITAVSSSQSAKNLANDMVRVSLEVRRGLANGTYSSQQVSSAVSGSASVTGTISFQSGISCGSSCVRSENHTSVAIVFNNFAVKTHSNTTTTVSGTVQYADSTFSQQSSLSFSSGGTVSLLSGTNVSYELIGTAVSGTFGTRDTLRSLSSSGTGDLDQRGTVITTGGSTFTF